MYQRTRSQFTQQVNRRTHSSRLLEVYVHHSSGDSSIDGLSYGRHALSVKFRAFGFARLIAETDTTDANVVDENVARKKELEFFLVDFEELIAKVCTERRFSPSAYGF